MFLMSAGNSAVSPAALDQHVGGEAQDRDFDCDGRVMSDTLFRRHFDELSVVLSTAEGRQARERRAEGPCDAVLRGARAFFDRRLMVWAETAVRAPTATWRPTISSSRRPVSRRGSSLLSAATSVNRARRRPAVSADRRG